MNDLETKLTHCFSNVFPDVSQSEVRRASVTSLAAWDSVAQVTLLTLISEQFGVDFELEDFEELVSYALILDHLQSRIR